MAPKKGSKTAKKRRKLGSAKLHRERLGRQATLARAGESLARLTREDAVLGREEGALGREI